ncbi:hypothetical protein DICPUDRAFT_77097 [Dictyostelium purpureum]|uniref:Uncharacterized protein n=1 Tax=Dictyostelium purpureum TaxID=5786 RepID=F0ZFK9_DICPU|nr:uncharacterized protein DICPUDRAFT_77097 [Dictyostelium purpureum]EGC37233.1 hypothetical protein DICPUDRAFT_77097 [Dictyostelium purpureum]|eukprot:XP_003286203.1 hypothetical protein DICPUDRAFT_77097 [Dictyostelium purpureum]
MTKFSNILYKDIIEILIKLIINKSLNQCVCDNFESIYNIDNQIVYEIREYSLVSKYFFKIVSNALQENININNYSVLKSFFNIKKKKVLNRISDNTLNIVNIFKEDIIGSDEINSLENCKFNLLIMIKDYMEPLGYLSRLKVNINKLYINGSNFLFYHIVNKSVFHIIERFNPKEIEFEPIEPRFHSNFSKLFSIKSIEKITISSGDHVEPQNFSRFDNEATNLKYLSIPILFHNIIRSANGTNDYENGCDPLYYGAHNASALKEWKSMINVLASNKTIDYLVLKNFCLNEKCIDTKLNCSLVTKGLKKLLQLNSTLKTLGLFDLDFFDDEIEAGLIKNTSINHLILFNESFQVTNNSLSRLFKNILPFNKSIQNIFFKWTFSLHYLFEFINENLYSNNNNNNIVTLSSLSIHLENIEEESNIHIFNSELNYSEKLNISEIYIFYKNKLVYQIINSKVLVFLNK